MSALFNMLLLYITVNNRNFLFTHRKKVAATIPALNTLSVLAKNVNIISHALILSAVILTLTGRGAAYIE